MSNENTTMSPGSFRKTSLLAGAFIALAYVSCTSLLTVAGNVLATTMPYLAGVGMFVALLSIFGAMLMTFRKLRKNAKKEAAIMESYIALAVIGTMGYCLAACVQTFQPNGDPASFWTYAATAAAVFVGIFGGGKYAAALFEAGGQKK